MVVEVNKERDGGVGGGLTPALDGTGGGPFVRAGGGGGESLTLPLEGGGGGAFDVFDEFTLNLEGGGGGVFVEVLLFCECPKGTALDGGGGGLEDVEDVDDGGGTLALDGGGGGRFDLEGGGGGVAIEFVVFPLDGGKGTLEVDLSVLLFLFALGGKGMGTGAGAESLLDAFVLRNFGIPPANNPAS